MTASPTPLTVVGCDGGGTKTALTAYRFAPDGTAVPIARSVSGGINYNTVGVETAVRHILDGIVDLHLAPGELAAVGIGDPSCDVDSIGAAGEAFHTALTDALGVPVLLKSDAYMTLYALTEGKCPGVLTISGTGAISVGESRDGSLHIRGGWGQLTGDEGSGYYIGLSGIKAALRAHDGVGPATALLPALLNFCGETDPRALIGVFYDGGKPFNPAAFAPSVDACAAAGDAEAARILRRAAGYLADYTVSLIAETGAHLVGVYGSVLTHNAAVRAAFEEAVRAQVPDAVIREPELSPEYAAALLAYRAICP